MANKKNESTGKLKFAKGEAVAYKTQTGKEVLAERFSRDFKKQNTEQKHATVKKLMSRKYGNKPFQKSVYGKNYKSGTVGKQTDRIKSTRNKQKKLTGLIKSTEASLSSASEEQKAALNKRLKNLTQRNDTASKNIETVKANRQKYLDLRDKALRQIAVKSNTNPQALSKKRKKLVQEQIEAASKGKKPKTSKGGGTVAP